MSSSTRFYNIVLLCITIVVINLSSQKTNESYALLTTTLATNTNTNNYRNHCPSSPFLSRFSLIDDINTMDQNSRILIRRQQETRMISSGRGQQLCLRRRGGGQTQQGLNVIKMSPSSSNVEDESTNNNDDQDDNLSKRRSARQSSSSVWRKDPRNRSVFGVLTASFLSLLGFTMVSGPLTPALGKHFQLQVGSLFGALTAAYPLGMMIGIFIWPSLSDRVGRRKVLSFSLFGSGLGLMTQAWVIQGGGTLTQFLLARSMTGLFAGSSPVSKAYLADIGTKDGKLSRYLSLKDASATLAFIMGPAVGGMLFEVRRKMIGASTELSKADVLDTSGSLAFVIAISAAASMLASLLAGVLVKEASFYKNKTELDNNTEKKNSNYDDEIATIKKGNNDEEELISCPLGRSLWTGVASVCVVSFLFNVGDSTFHAFFSAFLRKQGIITKDIGLLFTCLACISFLVSTTMSSKVMKSIGPVLACASGLTLTGSSLLLLGLAASGSILIEPSFAILTAIAAVYFCGVPLYGPTIPTMLLRCVPSNRRGFILGLDGFINTLARIVTPIITGEIYRRYNASAAFTTAGVAVVCGATIALTRRFLTLRDRNRKPEI
mmetsp:Transcript_23507/g.26361  ORF Transcript_23507/g.26361 Transcript_23507/m.26361 type:complete len:606 (-) Transcript_23507:1539-3356(-)